ncbi:UDP-glucose 4-epimerase GalE [Variovorax paradoxus]|uniref:UDP-glucose 4-epimerase n=1 Tax=Variovorax paradoxus (strain EPS) TaxID=595537 RepID=E6UXC7_VARPE|nr:UDP-glucose 4-epimerase GalE [Variovorax paradoxus]ADU38844.1 UDP-glucose 4-epimerase [Variovorax paradoxus EPS]
MNKKVLITGGAGYIGSHAAVTFLEAGYDVVILDNFSNGSADTVRRVEDISKRGLRLIEGDIRDKSCLHQIFSENEVYAVLHFAGLKSVAESVSDPLRYYENNVAGTVFLCEAMEEANVRRLVFSSSATVYGDPVENPVSERCLTGKLSSPYGRSKSMVEEVLQDIAAAKPAWHIAILRYFNPAGAHPSGLIGESPNGPPNNLIPYISQVAAGWRDVLRVFGDDYPTPDGTGVRDYIHVQDLAEGHLSALEAINKRAGLHIWNLGTGRGYSVLEVIRAFEIASGRSINFEIERRRLGDVAECWADPTKAQMELNWKANRSLTEMMTDAWRWQKNSLPSA